MENNNITPNSQEPVEKSNNDISQEPQQPAAKTPTPEPQKAAPTTQPEPAPAVPEHVLPPVNYKHKILLMSADFIAIVGIIHVMIIISIIRDISNDTFSFISNRMLAVYCVWAITIAIVVLAFVCKSTKSASTRYQRDNQVRQNPNIKVWLTGFDWGWPILFLPTMVLMAAAGVLGLLLELVPGDTKAVAVIQSVIGGTVIFLGAINAAVVIFKLKPVTLGLIVGSVAILLLLLLLHGPGTFIGFFKSFRYLGVNIEPLGYLLLAYIWSIFLRIIWLKSLFFYWVFLPNRLELQHGLSESNDSIDRDDLRMQIDTDDVILRWFNVGIITFYFPQLDRLPITNVIFGIHKKAVFANRIASIKSMQN